MEVTIRKLEPAARDEDHDALMAARRALYEGDEDLKFLSYTLKVVTPETYSTWLRSHREAGIDYFAAATPEEPIAGLCVVRADDLTGFEGMTLSVRPEHRRQGIGKTLLENALRVADGQLFRAVDVAVYADNRPMLMLALATGFIPYDIDPRRRADGGDLVRLRRHLT